MKMRNAVLGIVAGAAMLACLPAPVVAQGPPPPGYAPQPWEQPPSEYREVQQRGYHDGIEGARKDFENHRKPNVDNRDEYKHPKDVPNQDRDAYRAAFRAGYQSGVDHIWSGGHP